MNIPIRALIIDADETLRQRLAGALSADGIVVAGETGDHAAAVEMIARLQPDVIVLSVESRDLVERRGVAALCRINPDSRVLALCRREQEHLMLEALRQGAWGYKIKDDKIQSEIGQAVRTTHRGGAVLGPHIAGKVLDELSHDRR